MYFFISDFKTISCSPMCVSCSTLKMQSIGAHITSPFPPLLSVISRTNESQVGKLPYMNKIFNLFISVFEQLYVILSISLTVHLKCSRLRHSSPPHFPYIVCHIARTNESQVGNLRYINKTVNSCVSIIRTNICSPIYFSYSRLKMQSIKAHILCPFRLIICRIAYKRVRSGICRM